MAMRYMPKEGGHKVVMVAHEHGGYVLYSEHRAEVDALKAENQRLRESHARLKTHRKVVGKFLSELYAIMVDPLEGPENIAQMTKSLRESALESRERLHGLPADWHKDSSLETWFPLTAEEEKRKDAEIAALKAEIQSDRALQIADLQVIAALKAENQRLRESHARLAAAMREIVDEEPCDPSGRPVGYCLTHDSRTPCSMIEARAALADALKLE